MTSRHAPLLLGAAIEALVGAGCGGDGATPTFDGGDGGGVDVSGDRASTLA